MNQRHLSLLLLFLAPLICRAQEQESPLTPALMQELQQLQQTALSSRSGYDFLEYLSDDIGPRLPGSPQAQAAEDYVSSEFKKLGLDVRQEPVTVPHWIRGEERAELVKFAGAAPGITQKIVVTALGSSVPTPAEGITAPVVVVNKPEELDSLAPNALKGKIVLFNQAFDNELAHAGFAHEAYLQVVRQRVLGANRAAELGASASLLRSIGSANFRLAHTGSVIYSGERKIPAGAISAEDADLIERLSRRGPVTMHLVLTPQALPDAINANVIGDLKGSRYPEQVIIVSAHLDSWDLGTGALDDGAGLAMVLQAAQAMTSLHLKPLRTIRFLAWMNEENGGSGYIEYLERHKAELGNHVAVIDIDVGSGHPLGYATDAAAQYRAMLHPLSSILQAQGAALSRASTDSTDFSDYGIASFDPIVDIRNLYDATHTAADTFDKVDLKGLQENAAMDAVLAYALASIGPRVAMK